MITQEESDFQSYQIPFGKISQTAKRSNDFELQRSPDDEPSENLYGSQDLFASQENTNLFIRDPSNNHDHTLQSKLGMKCGRTVLREPEDSHTFSTRTLWNYHEDLPHPKKLIHRKRLKNLSPVRKHQKDHREGTGVKQHLKQLKVKQSRQQASSQLIVKFPFASRFNMYNTNLNIPFENPNQSYKSENPCIPNDTDDFGKKIVLQEETVSVSSWDEVETWIHQRWKSASIHIRRLEE